MPLYVIERNFAEQIELDDESDLGVKLVNDDVGVKWVYSFLSADKKKTYCLYEAPNPEAIREAIREAARRNGVPADVITEVSQYTPSV
jgi:hypothetical protein